MGGRKKLPQLLSYAADARDTRPEGHAAVADAQVWGDASQYDAANGAKPRTVREMRQVLASWV